MTVSAAALILEVNEQRVRHLIATKRLKAKRRKKKGGKGWNKGRYWDVDRQSVLEFKGSPRKAGRPRKPSGDVADQA